MDLEAVTLGEGAGEFYEDGFRGFSKNNQAFLSAILSAQAIGVKWSPPCSRCNPFDADFG